MTHYSKKDGQGVLPEIAGLRHEGMVCRLPGLILAGMLAVGAICPFRCGAIVFTPLVSFGNTNGTLPYAGLVQGSNGNFYGTTEGGGTNGHGTVFEVTTNGTLTVLYNFFGANDGAAPQAGLILGRDGNFYGTTSGGGSNAVGTVFEVASNGAFLSLASFNGTNGAMPLASLFQGADDNFYGTASAGGANGDGTVFELTTNDVLSALFSFSGTNGSSPLGALVQGPNGSFFGTTAGGGTSGLGTIFNLGPGAGFTNWSFVGASGPQAGLTPGATGGFSGTNGGGYYGMTASGGTNGQGTVFQFTPAGGITTLLAFNVTNGAQPSAALVQGADGNLYGTTLSGGTNGHGTVFSLTPSGAITTLYSFPGGNNGAAPQAPLAQGTDGNFYGTTAGGGKTANGTVFELSGFPPFITSQPASQTVPGGATALFAVSAGGPGPLTYQWQLSSNNLTDGGSISGSATTNLTIGDATIADAGTIWVVVANAGGSVTSAPVVLSVVEPPTVTITSPAQNARIPQPVITITGKASDNVAVSRVYYQLDGMGWSLASTANGWSNWTAKATLPPGTNSVQAYAVNILGMSSATSSVSFFCTIASAPVMVEINGGGKVTPDYDGQALTIGKTYTMTATPASGFVFSNWAGGTTTNPAVLTDSARLSFVMANGLVLQANFATNLFSAVSGAYTGLFYDQTNGVSPQSSGAFTITTTAKGGFSGNLQMGVGRYSFHGQFDATGNAQVTVSRGKSSPLTAVLSLDLTQGSGQITGMLSDGTWMAELTGNRAVFGAANPAPFAGSYTMILPGVVGSTTEPAGDSSGTITVDASGKIRFSASLADGTKASQSATISKNGQWPLYLKLYGGQGLLLGWLDFTNGSPTNPTGMVTWIKPPLPAAKIYPGGFALQAAVMGSSYVRPQSGANILSFTNAAVALSGGDLEQSITNLFTLGAHNHVTSSNGNLHLSFSTATGSFSGSVSDAGTTKPLSFGGVVLQDQNIGRGFFLGADQSGEALIFGN